MAVRGLCVGVVLMAGAVPAAGLQRADLPGRRIVEPGEVVEWKGSWAGIYTYEFGRLEGAPVYGELDLTLPWSLRIGGLAGRFRVTFHTNYRYRSERFRGYRYSSGFREPRRRGYVIGEPVVRRVRVEEMRVLLDGEPYLTIPRPMPDSMQLDFPYPVKELELRVELSEGGSVGMRVRLPERHRVLARGVDFRKGLYLEGPQWPHEGPFFRAPRRDREREAVFWPGRWGCLTRPALGRVRWVRVRVERHPRLEAGEAAEMEVRVHQPVYELVVWDAPFPQFAGPDEERRFRVRIECETERGRRLEKVFEGELLKP